MDQAIEIIDWHMQETRRLLTAESSTAIGSDPQKLMKWLLEKNISITNTREIKRMSPLRDSTRVNDAIAALIEHNVIRIMKDGNKTFMEVNPFCF
jgi:hypothetical protein